MKTVKSVLLTFILFLLPFLASAEVVEFRNFAGGDFSAGPRGGKLTRVEAFAPDATGTVSLQSVYSAAVFTNVVEIDSFTATNMTVVASNRLWRAASTNDAPPLATNTYPAASFTFTAWQRAHPVETLVSSNTAVVTWATTNRTSVFSHNVSVTNAIISGGSLSGHVYGGNVTNTWIAPGEHLIYTGPVGGFLRLIVE